MEGAKRRLEAKEKIKADAVETAARAVTPTKSIAVR